MKAAIIDDLFQCREEIRQFLCRYLDETYTGEIPTIAEFTNGTDFLSGFSKDDYDIIFIDQYMNGLNGLDTARAIRELDKLVPLVFVTTSRDHAIDSYEVRACGYLVKPYRYEEFKRTMELAGLEKIRIARFICIEQEKILLREILWCSQDNHYVQIHTSRRGILRFRLSFYKFTSLLAGYPQFLICYKGCMVNMERVKHIDGLNFMMDTGDSIPFSQRDRKKMEAAYHSYIFQLEREGDLL